MKNILIALVAISAIVVLIFIIGNYISSQQPEPEIADLGPQDNARVTAIVLSVRGTNVFLEVEEILKYRRYPNAAWEQLQESDQIIVSLDIAKVVSVELGNTSIRAEVDLRAMPSDTTIDAKDVFTYIVTNDAGESAAVPGIQINVSDLSEERISDFVSTLAGKKIEVSMNCSNTCDIWSDGKVHKIF